MPAAKVEVVDFRVDGPGRPWYRRHVGPGAGPRLRIRRLSQQRATQLVHDRLRDVVLHRKHVLKRTVVCPRPQLIAIRDVHQLDRDTHALAGLANAAFQDGGHVEGVSHLGDRRVLALEVER